MADEDKPTEEQTALFETLLAMPSKVAGDIRAKGVPLPENMGELAEQFWRQLWERQKTFDERERFLETLQRSRSKRDAS